jgi:protein-tyrosine phosphatase
MTMDDSAVPQQVSPLAGAFNFRDLGGLPLADGRRTRPGRLFRSDTLQALTPQDVQLLRTQIGLRAVIDLRLADEVAGEGRGALAAAGEVDYVHAPLEMASTDGIPPDQVLNRLYARCLTSASLPQAIMRIAETASRPTLFHCAAGKDRTGVVAAVVLGLLGVADDAIVADYLRSAASMPRMIERFMTWPRYRDHLAAMPPEVYAVEEGPIRTLLATLNDDFGGARGWAVHHGIGAPLVRELERHLILAA